MDMMIIKTFGIIDIIAAVLILLSLKSHLISAGLIVSLGIYFVIKGSIFAAISRDIASFLEIISGILIVLTVYTTIPNFFMYLIIVFLIQKGILSLVD